MIQGCIKTLDRLICDPMEQFDSSQTTLVYEESNCSPHCILNVATDTSLEQHHFNIEILIEQVWRDTESGARDPVTIWRPRPQQRYVAIGCVVVPEYYEPDRSVVSCVHEDFVENVPLGQVPLWRDYTSTALWPCSLWRVQNDAGTFLARRDHQAPSPHLSYTVRI